MEFILLFIRVILSTIAICLPIGGLIYLLLHYVVLPFILNLHIQTNRIELTEIYATAESVISIECTLYEKYFETNTTADIQSLSNSEFLNIYNDLSMRCLKSFSENFWRAAEVYVTREELQTYITQRVFNYLHSKIRVSDDVEEEEE